MTKSEVRQFTSWLGKRSYEARLARFGIERLQEIARENGKKGGRPKGSGSTPLTTGGKKLRPSASSLRLRSRQAGLRAVKAAKKNSGAGKGR